MTNALPLADTTVVFDLDGTLIDTAPDLAATANTVLQEIGRTSLTVEELRPYVGHGARATLRHGITHTGGGFTEEELEPLVTRFLEVYTAHIADNSHPYPGVLEVMDTLGAQGAALAVCTNKRERPARLLLETLGLMPRFAGLVGGDTCPTRKPDPESLAETLKRAGSRPIGIMVGDTTADVGAAKALGIPVIAVSFGYSPLPATELGANTVIDHYDDFLEALPPLIEKVRARARSSNA